MATASATTSSSRLLQVANAANAISVVGISAAGCWSGVILLPHVMRLMWDSMVIFWILCLLLLVAKFSVISSPLTHPFSCLKYRSEWILTSGCVWIMHHRQYNSRLRLHRISLTLFFAVAQAYFLSFPFSFSACSCSNLFHNTKSHVSLQFCVDD